MWGLNRSYRIKTLQKFKMKKYLFFLVLIPKLNFAQADSMKLQYLKEEVKSLSNKVDEVKRDQLNYLIEKNLLKETYSNNYERINLFLTGILGIFGLFSFLGIRDLNSIKKEYREELENLKRLQLDVEFKAKDFDESKKKYDKEITEIIEKNEEQSNKIKLLEIKEKISTLFTQKSYDRALEYCIIALELSPNDIGLLLNKGLIYTKTKKYEEAIINYLGILEIEQNNNTAISNLAELYLFVKNEVLSDELVKKHPDIFNSKSDGEVLKLFNLIKLFNKADAKNIKDIVIAKIDRTDLKNKKKRMSGWDVSDAIIYIHSQPDSEHRTNLVNFLWYLDGQLKAKEALERLGEKVFIEMPQN